MTWRFRKRVKIIPGVYLNFSNSGVSTTIGPRGLNINIGQKGSYLNTSVPGTGLYNRVPLKNKSKIESETDEIDDIEEKLNWVLHQYYDGGKEIKSGDIAQLTSKGFSNLKTTIIAAHHEYAELEQIQNSKIQEGEVVGRRLTKIQKSIFRFLFKKRIERLSSQLKEIDEELTELKEQLDLSSVELKIENDDTFQALYSHLDLAYQLLVKCSKIWDVTSSKDVNRIQERSYANTLVTRVEVKSFIEHSGLIVTEKAPLRLINKNGGDLYFYPGFIIVHNTQLDFAIVDYSEFNVEFVDMHFVESDNVPVDSEVVGSTWRKVNKDGTPDRRFANNFQIPVARYAQLNFKSSSGMNESYLFSNFESAQLFHRTLSEYVKAIKTANSLLHEFSK